MDLGRAELHPDLLGQQDATYADGLLRIPRRAVDNLLVHFLAARLALVLIGLIFRITPQAQFRVKVLFEFLGQRYVLLAVTLLCLDRLQRGRFLVQHIVEAVRLRQHVPECSVEDLHLGLLARHYRPGTVHFWHHVLRRVYVVTLQLEACLEVCVFRFRRIIVH